MNNAVNVHNYAVNNVHNYAFNNVHNFAVTYYLTVGLGIFAHYWEEGGSRLEILVDQVLCLRGQVRHSSSVSNFITH